MDTHTRVGKVKLWRYLPILLAVLIFPAICFCENAKVPESGFPFRPGEKLTYKIRWQFIPAGIATLEVLPEKDIDGVRANHFRLTVKTNAFVDKFYKVRDRIDAFTDPEMTRSMLYTKKQREGKHKRDITVTFDWKKAEAQYVNFGKKEKPVALLPHTFDPLSVFYAFRLKQLAVDSVLEAPVSDGKKCTMGKAVILKRQKIELESGEYDTYLVEPELKEVSGVFKKSKNARLLIWVTADRRHLPVKITSSVVVGNFIAELISAERTG